jgi:hypothetical protein
MPQLRLKLQFSVQLFQIVQQVFGRLWPFKTHLVNGVFWARPWLIAVNYAALILTYTYLRQKREPFNVTGYLKLS